MLLKLDLSKEKDVKKLVENFIANYFVGEVKYRLNYIRDSSGDSMLESIDFYKKGSDDDNESDC